MQHSPNYPSLLLLTVDSAVMIAVASAARRAGYTVAPGRTHETGADALTRVAPQVALVQLGHAAADSISFTALAQELGTHVVLFSAPGRTAAEQAAIALVSARSPFPLLEYGGSGDELITALDAAFAR